MINVAFAFDKNYYRQAFCAIASLLVAGKNLHYNLYLLIDSDVDNKIQKELTKNLKKISKNININFINMQDSFQNSYECRGITKACYYRLMLHRVLPERVKKVIYSDVDVIFNTDLVDVWKFDIENAFFASNKDALINLEQRREELKQEFSYWNELDSIGKNYRNSGFLLLNLDRFRKENFDNKIIELSKCNFNYQDQDVLNFIFLNRQSEVKTLSNKYCVFIRGILEGLYDKAYNEGIITLNDLEEVKNAPAIYHYAGAKPWNINYIGSEIWWDFVKKHTPYYNYFKKRFNKLNNVSTPIEKIFSVKNEYKNEIKRKIITLFGVKIKFKVKNKRIV